MAGQDVQGKMVKPLFANKPWVRLHCALSGPFEQICSSTWLWSYFAAILVRLHAGRDAST